MLAHLRRSQQQPACPTESARPNPRHDKNTIHGCKMNFIDQKPGDKKSWLQNLQNNYQTRRAQAPPISEASKRMPTYDKRDLVLASVRRNRVTVISGDTGCGKSTLIPQLICDAVDLIPDDKVVVCTQPRRVAAITLPEYVSRDRGQELWKEVGYQIRFVNEFCEETRLIYAGVGWCIFGGFGFPCCARLWPLMAIQSVEKEGATCLQESRDDSLVIVKFARSNQQGTKMSTAPAANTPPDRALDLHACNSLRGCAHLGPKKRTPKPPPIPPPTPRRPSSSGSCTRSRTWTWSAA